MNRILLLFLFFFLGGILVSYSQGSARIEVNPGVFLFAVNGGGEDIELRESDGISSYEEFWLEWKASEKGEEHCYLRTFSGYYLDLDKDYILVAIEKERNDERFFILQYDEKHEKCRIFHSTSYGLNVNLEDQSLWMEKEKAFFLNVRENPMSAEMNSVWIRTDESVAGKTPPVDSSLTTKDLRQQVLAGTSPVKTAFNPSFHYARSYYPRHYQVSIYTSKGEQTGTQAPIFLNFFIQSPDISHPSFWVGQEISIRKEEIRKYRLEVIDFMSSGILDEVAITNRGNNPNDNWRVDWVALDLEKKELLTYKEVEKGVFMLVNSPDPNKPPEWQRVNKWLINTWINKGESLSLKK